MEFRVIWEIEIDADSPRRAAEQARVLQLTLDMPATVFDIWDHAKQKMHRVELAAATDRLDNAEMALVRAALRRLQCSPELRPDMKDVLTVMLIFLDEDEGRSGRGRSRRL